MPNKLGTRKKQGFSDNHPPAGTIGASLTRDVGMTKRAVASMTFVAGSGQVQAANGTFANFAVGDPVIVRGTNLNNGEHQVTAIDGVNAAFLVLDQGVKSEGPVANTEIRTP